MKPLDVVPEKACPSLVLGDVQLSPSPSGHPNVLDMSWNMYMMRTL